MRTTEGKRLRARRRHHVVVIGSGFGGLFAAHRLKRADVDLTLISRDAHHLFQPLLYQVATGILSEGEIAPATREILRRHRNVKVLLGEVTDIDLDSRTVVSTADAITTTTTYDSLIVAAGANTSYFGHDEFRVHAPGLKTIDDALELRARILGAFELAELETDPTARDERLTFIVVGAGPTGVEMAGQIAELAHRAISGEYRNIDPNRARIVLVDALDEVLGQFGTKLSSAAMFQLHRMSVEVRLGQRVVGVDDRGLNIRDNHGASTRIPGRTIVWTAGVQASPLAVILAKQSGADLDRGGRITVLPDCSLPGHPEVFAIGDMASLNGYPGVAPVAMQQGRYVGDRISRQLREKAVPHAFRYVDKGSVATISRFRAVASIGRLHFGGFFAWLLWLVVHLIYLVGFKNRATTVMHWTISFLGRGHAERTVIRQPATLRAEEVHQETSGHR